MMLRTRGAAIAAISLLLAGAGEPAALVAPATTDVIAQRGAARLTVGELRDLLDRADPAARAQIVSSPANLAAFVRDRLLQLGLVADARAKSFDQRPDMIQRMNDARDAVLAQGFLGSVTQIEPGFPTDADISATYEANKARFVLPKQYHLAQIALVVPQGAPREVDDEARRKALDLRAQAIRPKADFADIARRNSQERGAAERGGDIGWVREDQLVPGIKDAVVGMAEGGISEPLRSQTGWHIVKLLGTRPPAPAALADVREQIAQALRQARQQQLIRSYIEEMLRREPIQLNEIDLARAIATPAAPK